MQLLIAIAFAFAVVLAVLLGVGYGPENIVFQAVVASIFAAAGKILWDVYERRKRKRDISDIVLAEINNFRDHTLANIKVIKEAVNAGKPLETYQIEKLYYLSDVPITIKNEQISILPKNLMAEIMRMHVRFRNIDIEIRTFWRLCLYVTPANGKLTDFQKMLMFKCVYLWIRSTLLLDRLASYRRHQDFPVDDPYGDCGIGNLSLSECVSLYFSGGDSETFGKTLQKIHAENGIKDADLIRREMVLLREEVGQTPSLKKIFDEHAEEMRDSHCFNVAIG